MQSGDTPEPGAEISALARVREAPCGAGRMVWRSWGAGAPLVMLHGGTGSWLHWVRNVISLSESRYVLAPDLPGLGGSDMPPEPYSPASIAEITARGIDLLLGNEASYDLVGFSFGALVSSQIALLHGRRLRSLTVVGPNSLGLPRAPVQLEKVRRRTGADRLQANRTNLGLFMLADPAKVDALALAIQDWNTTHARLRSKPFAEATTLRDAVALAPTRVNAIWGAADVTAWPTLSARLATLRAARPDVDARVIESAGHWVAYDAPEAFNAMLREMIA